MKEIFNGLVTSGTIITLLTLAGNYINNRRKDGNDRIEEYREDNKTLKKELREAYKKIDRVEEENRKQFLEIISLKEKVKDLSQAHG